jgi:hypothetical protein
MTGTDCINTAVNKVLSLAPELATKRSELSVIMVQLLGDYQQERGKVPVPQGKLTK